jgi:hypothetical protein
VGLSGISKYKVIVLRRAHDTPTQATQAYLSYSPLLSSTPLLNYMVLPFLVPNISVWA